MADAVVRSSLEPQVIGLGDTATFTLEVQSSGLSRVRFAPTFTLENLEIVAGPADTEDVSIINGALTRAYRLSWLLRPRAAGPARVRGIALKLVDSVVALRDREIQVQPQAAGAGPSGSVPPGGGAVPHGGLPGGPGSGGLPDPQQILEELMGGEAAGQRRSAPAVFLRSEVQPAQPLAGEQALYTLYVYTRQDLAAVSEKDEPTFRGFWVREIPLPEHSLAELSTVDGVRYTRVALRRKALFALRPGRHALEPASADVVVETYDTGFFAPPIPRYEQLHLVAPESIVEVQPLPPPPPGFDGTVGQLRLAAQVAPGALREGEAATVTVRLSGIGNLQGVPAPRLDAATALAISPPEQQSRDLVSGTSVQGERTWTYVVVPHRSGHFALQVSAVPFFDPVRREYRLAMAPPLAVTTLPAAPPAAAGSAAALGGSPTPAGNRSPEQTGSAAAAASRAGDWGPLWARLTRWTRVTRLTRWMARWREWPHDLAAGWAATSWPGRVAWSLALGCGLLLLSVLARRRDSPAPHPAGAAPATPQAPPSAALRPAAGAGARQLELRLAEAAAASRPRRVAAAVEEGWREFLAGRGDLPPGAPPARWPELVRGRQWPGDAAEELAGLAADIAYLRQAPQLSATDDLRREIVARSRRLLRRLR